MIHRKLMLLLVALLIINSAFAKHVNKIEIEPRIVNGFDAVRGQFPFYVYLEIESPHRRKVCGGSLISNEYIVTAGHCLENATSVQAHLGSLRAWKKNEIRRLNIDVDPKNLHIHPEYNELFTMK